MNPVNVAHPNLLFIVTDDVAEAVLEVAGTIWIAPFVPVSNLIPTDPPCRVKAAAPVFEPMVMTFATAAVPIDIVFIPVPPFPKVTACAPVPGARSKLPVCKPVPPIEIVPVVIAVPIATEPAVWVLPMVMTLAAVPPIAKVVTAAPVARFTAWVVPVDAPVRRLTV